jgi:hypothetical protein
VGTKDLADFNIKLLFSDVCKKRNEEGLEEYYSIGLRRVLFLTVTECGALKDTYTGEAMTAEEICRIHRAW